MTESDAQPTKASRVRLIALVALAVPVGLTAIAATDQPAVGALALAAAAAALALLLAGPVFRIVLATLIALLGVCVILVAIYAPDVEPSVLAIVAGAVQIVVAIAVAATVRWWPQPASRYTRSRLEGATASDWDALSAGDDPTESP